MEVASIEKSTDLEVSLRLSLDFLNEVFQNMSYRDRIKNLYRVFPQEEVLVTSSFGTKSVFLLHLLHEINPTQKIHFINTTYHFKETIAYKEQLTELFDLEVMEVLPEAESNKLTKEEQWWIEHPKMCCSINKVAPLAPIKANHRVWMSSLMAYQTDFRKNLRIFEPQGDIIKFHPLIDIDEGEFLYQLGVNQLPRHPLEAFGYGSVGCEHCTVKGEGRSGRWKNSDKTECGLHPNYFLNKAGV